MEVVDQEVSSHELPPLRTIISGISWITAGVYLVIAVVLSLLAVISFYGVFLEVTKIFTLPSMTSGIIQVLHALLVTIIILELLETVTVYLTVHQIMVKPLLIAGLTAMIRRVLVFGVEPSEPLDIFATVAVIAVLTIAIIYIGKEENKIR
ncbi:MAG TPA: phosphate-starvation-inducible PsiE family protein [Methanomicrobiales archaeon]|jgi:uncharacterized membrane protein (DUF373 family)|nr:phosphate-starvation-inducible PsiE family protein [Methanomicrobiales archaeon]